MKIKREKFAGRTPSVLRTLGVAAVVLAALLVAGGFLAAQYGFFGGGTNAPSVPEDTMTRGLVGYWSMDEGMGGTAYDGSGDGNDGTIYGAQWTKGKNAGALQFDGKDDYVDIGTITTDFSMGFTYSAWVYIDSVKTWARFIAMSEGGSDNDNILFARYNNTNDLTYEVYVGATSGGKVTASNVLELGKWMHLAVTEDSSGNVVIYKNGIQIKTGTTGIPAVVSRIDSFIGKSNWSMDQYFNGIIDEVRIYNRALSAEEVRYHYNHGGPVAHWKFDEGSGTTIHDSSGNGHNGTMHE